MKKINQAIAILLAILSFASIFAAFASAEDEEGLTRSKYYQEVQSGGRASVLGICPFNLA